MIEIPEAVALSRQLTERLAKKRIEQIVAKTSPHKLAWYFGDPDTYTEIAAGKRFRKAVAVGGMVEASFGDVDLLFSEGINLRYFAPGAALPVKHQLLVKLDDDSALVASVQMYGGMGVYPAGENDNKYYLLAKQKPLPLDAKFNKTYFRKLLSAPGAEKLSAKALLATEQRIPGLGNGVLQDILYCARIHPKRKLATLGDEERETLFHSVKEILRRMADAGGRDTERDLNGNRGGYATRASQSTVGKPCPVCGSTIQKAAYLGGSVYFCPGCQPL